MATPGAAVASRWRLRALLLALGLVSGLRIAAARPPAGEIFQRALRAVDSTSTEEDIAGSALLLARSAEAVPSWIEIRLGGTLGEFAEPLSAQQWQALEQAGPLLERDQVLEHVSASLSSASSREWRLAALELMRWPARARDLRLVIQICGEDERLLEELHESVCGIAARDATLFGELDSLGGVPQAVALELMRGVGMAGEPQGLTWLTAQLDLPARTDVALQEIGRLVRSSPAARADEVAVAVRPFLHAESASRRRQAMLTLAALGDELATPVLIRALDSEDRGERKTAFAALREISGLTLPDRAEVWRAWFQAEVDWWRDEATGTLERLQSEDDAEVVAAVRGVGERSLRRDELSLQLTPLLRTHPSAAVRLHAARALTRLGDPVCLKALARSLEDPDDAVRAQAHAGLCAISGRSLPADADAWNRALQDPR